MPDASPVAAATGCPTAPYGIKFNAPGTGKRVALTFDDGPGRDTRAILGVLAANRVAAHELDRVVLGGIVRVAREHDDASLVVHVLGPQLADDLGTFAAPPADQNVALGFGGSPLCLSG
jgi:hypothetical protein